MLLGGVMTAQAATGSGSATAAKKAKKNAKTKAGRTGSTGATGATGSNGSNGAAGAKGNDGAAGTKGADGAAGKAGANGVAGAAGTAGPKGDTGARGPAGPAGPSTWSPLFYVGHAGAAPLEIFNQNGMKLVASCEQDGKNGLARLVIRSTGLNSPQPAMFRLNAFEELHDQEEPNEAEEPESGDSSDIYWGESADTFYPGQHYSMDPEGEGDIGTAHLNYADQYGRVVTVNYSMSSHNESYVDDCVIFGDINASPEELP
jgi:hypothetical protein